MARYSEFELYDIGEVQRITKRLDILEKARSKDGKIDLILHAYQDEELLGYLLYDYELEFLESNLSCEFLDTNYITYNLEKIGIICDTNTYHCHIFTLSFDLVKKGIDYYNLHKNEINNTKYVIYFMLGLIRYYGAIEDKIFFKYIKKYFKTFDQNYYNVALSHPLFKRFVTPIYLNKKIYYTHIEYEIADLDFIKYQRRDILDNLDLDAIIYVGKYYFNVESLTFKKAINNPTIALMLNKIDRMELILYIGFANYSFESLSNILPTKFYDYNYLDTLDEDSKREFTSFIFSLPMYYPNSENNIFMNPFKAKVIIDLFDVSISLVQRNYNIDYQCARIKVLNGEFNKSYLDDYSFPLDEAETLEQFEGRKLKKYFISSYNKDSLELLDIEDEKLVYIKLNQFLDLYNLSNKHKVVSLYLLEFQGETSAVYEESYKRVIKSELENYVNIVKRLKIK